MFKYLSSEIQCYIINMIYCLDICLQKDTRPLSMNILLIFTRSIVYVYTNIKFCMSLRNSAVLDLIFNEKGKGRHLMNILKLFCSFVFRTRKLFTV